MVHSRWCDSCMFLYEYMHAHITFTKIIKKVYKEEKHSLKKQLKSKTL